MTSRTQATLLVLVCVALWALIPVVAKLGQTTLDNHQFLFWSSLVSCLVLTTTAFVRGRIADLRSYSAKDWLQLIALGLLGTYVYYLLLYLGYSRAVGMEVLVFQYTWPLLVVLLSLVILRERMTLRKIVALVFGCIGVVAVLTKGQLRTIRVDNPGVIALVVLGALSFALFSVLSKKVRKDPLMVTAVYFLVATVASLISMLTFSAWTIPSVEDFPPVLANGILVNGFSYVLWLMALRKADASYVAPFVFITPVLSAFYLILLFNEPLSPAHGIGLVCIVAAGLINSPGRRDRMS